MPFEIMLLEFYHNFLNNLRDWLGIIFTFILASTAIIGLILTMKKITTQQNLRQQELDANKPLILLNPKFEFKREEASISFVSDIEHELYKIVLEVINYGKRYAKICSYSTIIYDPNRSRFIPQTRLNSKMDETIPTDSSLFFMVNINRTYLTNNNSYYIHLIIEYIDPLVSNSQEASITNFKWFFSNHDTPEHDRFGLCFEEECKRIDDFISNNPITEDIV